MELASPIWNSEMHYIFAITEHYPTFPLILIVIVVELNFSTDHGLECKKGGLVIIQRQDEIRFELQDLAARALILSVVHPICSPYTLATEYLYMSSHSRRM